MANLKVAFAENTEKTKIDLLRGALRDFPIPVDLVSPAESPQYLFRIDSQSFQMTLPDDERPVFAPVHGNSYVSACDFVAKATRVAKWVQVKELTNPASGIGEGEFKIELFRLDLPGNYSDSAAASALDWREAAYFGYEFLSGAWQKPAFRLKITNTGNRILWVHALYLGHNFGISDRFLPKQQLQPGQETWLSTQINGSISKTIPFPVEDTSAAQDIPEVKEWIKIFISTGELELQRFNQEGLQGSVSVGASRSLSRHDQLPGPDWTSRNIEMTIQMPVEGVAGAAPEAEPPEFIPEPPTVPMRGKPSVGDKLKNWFRDVTKSKQKEAGEPPLGKDFEKVYPELGEEADEAIPPRVSNRSIKKELDEILTGAEPPEPGSPKPELPEALKTGKAGDQVDCSVYAPPEVQKGDDVFIQVWLHLPQLSEQAKAMALEFDDTTGQRAFQSLKIPLEKGDELSLVLEAEGIELDEKVQNLTWNGTLQSAQFVASVPEDYPKNKAIFTLRVFLGEIPAGHIKFILKIAAEAVKVSPEPVGTEAKRYKKAFISYSSKDRDEVLKRVQMLDKLGIEFFQDLLSLNPGERWEKKLYENINDSDVFFLFWSTAAKDSKWVLQELEYAINLKHGNEDSPPLIQPVPIEGPPIVSPPEKLGHMHFNDRILYFILKKQS